MRQNSCSKSLGGHRDHQGLPFASRKQSFDSSARFSEAQRRRQRLYEPLQQYQKAIQSAPAEQQHDCQADSTRRRILFGSSASALVALTPFSSKAMNMPQAFDNAWSAIGGGPADLVYPEEFLGRWLTESTLTKVEMPLGPNFVPNLQVVDRAMREDLKKPIRYEIAWIRNKKGKVIIDRKFNTARLMSVYLGRGGLDEQGITWDPDDPNRLAIRLPGGMNILTRVTRRSEETAAGLDRRINTSEFFEQIFETRDSVEPRVKASQCFTKYKWRPPEEAARSGGPAIVATQVVSDYLTPYDGETMMLKAQNRPVVVYTYTMSFRRAYTSSSPLQA